MAILWGSESALRVDFLPRGTTVNGPCYASLLHRLCSSNYRGETSRESQIRCAASSRQRICSQVQHNTGFSKLNQPAYSPDLAPSDDHLFSNLKNFLRGRNFETADEARMTMNHYLESLEILILFSRGIKSLYD